MQLKSITIGAVLLGTSSVLLSAQAPATERPPAPASTFTVDELLRLKRVSDPQLSPDGQWIAYVVTDVNQDANTRNSDIWVVAADGGTPIQLTAEKGADERPRWSSDGKQIAFVSTRDGGSQIWVTGFRAPAGPDTRPAGSALPPPKPVGPKPVPRKVTSIATEASGVIWSPDGKWLAFVSDVYPECESLTCNAERLKANDASKVKARILDGLLFRHWNAWKDGRFSHLFLVSADGKVAPRDLTPGKADVPPFSLGGPEDYAFAGDSKEVAFATRTDPVEATGTNSDLFVLSLDDPQAKPRKITTNPAADGGPAYSRDGKFVAYRAQARPGFESDRWQLMLFDRASGQHRSITTGFDRQVDGYVWMPDSQQILFTAEDQGSVRAYRIGISGGAPKPLTSTGSAGDLNVAPDGSSIVMSWSSLTVPPEIFRINADGSGLTPITRTNDAVLSRAGLRAAESVWYEGAGGTKVQAWIVTPPTFRESGKYPLLFLVHGGPQGAWNDAWSNRWNPQVFANAGYVVFMPNPRGSTGFGQQFTDEISGDWGGKVYEDLMKGADYAEALKYVDRTRMGAAGGSYGGYMVNWFLGHTERFKAFVSHAGVYNLTSMYGVTEELWFTEWEFKGTPWNSVEMYERWSPHHHAKKFKTPTLVVHGELDFRVPIGEGFQLFTTLQRLGVPSKMLYFPDEGHWIGKPQNSALWYRTFIDWMDRWVKGSGAPTAGQPDARDGSREPR